MENKYKKLIISEAINQGYKYFIYPSDGYQALKSLDDYSEDEINWDANPTLCQKEPQHPNGMTADELREHLAETISEEFASQTGCDTDIVYDAIMEIDFNDTASKIQEKLNKIDFYWQSEIEIIPDKTKH